MALSLAKAAPLITEIKLAQAFSEFEAILSEEQKHRSADTAGSLLRIQLKSMMRFTAEIDRDAIRNRKSRQ